jgi:hypothetical protein
MERAVEGSEKGGFEARGSRWRWHAWQVFVLDCAFGLVFAVSLVNVDRF